MKIAINGFGRIGRLVFRSIMQRNSGDLEIVAVNDIGPLDNLAYLLRHDSVHPEPDARIESEGDELRWNDRKVRYLSEKDPARLPWRELDVGLVIEASGQFTKKEDAERHMEGGAARVLITAPAKGDVTTICPGVNDEAYEPARDQVVSAASCTTNALAPVAKVLHDRFGIAQGALMTVHAYTSSQGLVDQPSGKWRRGRAAALNIVPTTTGAAKSVGRVLPELEGRIDGMAMRVPVASGSIIDFTAQTEKSVSVQAVNDAFREAAGSERLRRVLGASDEELVSSDIVYSPLSSLVDLGSTMTFGDRMVKVLAWYDNEWGYARCVVDLADHMEAAERTAAVGAAT